MLFSGGFAFIGDFNFLLQLSMFFLFCIFKCFNYDVLLFL